VFRFTNKDLIHPEAFQKRYVHKDKMSNPVEAGIPWNFNSFAIKNNDIVYNTKPNLIGAGVLISGEIPRITDFEPVPACFITESSTGMIHDRIIDEQMLIIRGEEGIYLFLGCGHPGVVNCLLYAAELLPGEKVMAVVGGMHLEAAETPRLEQTVQTLIDFGVTKVIPLHCAGESAVNKMKKVFVESCFTPLVGDMIEFE